MSTVAILVSAVFWTWLWGPIGLLLATPLTVLLVVMGKYVPALRFLDVLLGDEPVLEPHKRIYQRLLALDEEEATELAEQYASEHSLEAAYDDVLIPALALAEIDRHRDRLDDQRKDSIRQAMREIVEELGDQERQRATLHAADRTVEIARGNVSAPTKPVDEAKSGSATASNGNGNANPAPGTPNGPPAPHRPTLPKGCVVNVLLLPAHDEADEIVDLMLAQVLELRGYCAHPISQTALASEMLEHVEKTDAHVIVVSALPPAAVAHARYLCKRLHAKYPEREMVIGLWTVKSDMNKAKVRITCDESSRLVTSLAQAIEQIQQMAAPMMMQTEKEKQTQNAEGKTQN
jgi:hypothetical protein